ncbi:MAG: UDP-N-acetylmuramate dehydrogenase [Solirubrobacteraceae bacterium]|jgi:UDP-N-acetylmuramate dehydrogenase|nr:UDP-N-acetylmuramate dehydrogenase [Solirubrobacteraceae bacterium]
MDAPLLSELTTLRLGGPAGRLVEARTQDELAAAVREIDAASEPLLVLAGGSNVVVADDGFRGTVLRVATSGRERSTLPDGRVRLDVEAGESWDVLVGDCVDQGLAGIEALSGIPGSVGATPIQNVGAYGQQVSDVIVDVRALDRVTGEICELAPQDCGFGYRSSAFKRQPHRWVVLRVSYALGQSQTSGPLRYGELARRLGIEGDGGAPIDAVREAVLELRRGKGMVLDPEDPDSVSAGSFFTNPVLSADAFGELERRLGPEVAPPAWRQPDGSVKTSAAWLIERADFARGYGDPDGIAISSKHTLALTNRGAGTTTELVALAREIAAGVHDAFGVDLVPEPVLVGHRW